MKMNSIGDVRGYGPMIGVEIVENKDSKTPRQRKSSRNNQ